AVMLNGATQASEYRGDGLDVHAAQFAFDLTSVTLANMWVALGSLGLAAGWAILAGRGEPGTPGRPAWPAWPAWIGWWALAVGAGYLVVRMAFPSPLWYFPHILFWVWVLVVSTRMLRVRRLRPQPLCAPLAGRLAVPSCHPTLTTTTSSGEPPARPQQGPHR